MTAQQAPPRFEFDYRGYHVFQAHDGLPSCWVRTPDGEQFFCSNADDARLVIEEDLEDLIESFTYCPQPKPHARGGRKEGHW